MPNAQIYSSPLNCIDHETMLVNPIEKIEERVNTLNKVVNKIMKVKINKKKRKFRNKRYKFYYGKYI